MPKVVLALPRRLEKLISLATRYTMKQTYAAAEVETAAVNKVPLPSERKKSKQRYPLISITRAATNHDMVYKVESRNT